MRDALTRRSDELADAERFALELEVLWKTLGYLLDHGQTVGRVIDGRPLRVRSALVDRARRLRRDLRDLSIEAAPHLGTCSGPVVDLPTSSPARSSATLLARRRTP